METVYLDITCLSCGSRTHSTREVDTDLLLGPMLERQSNRRAFSGAKTACISIVLDRCSDCLNPKTGD